MSEYLQQDYVVSEEIGRGRFGTVYRCSSADSGESYAVKSIDKVAITAGGDSLDTQCLFTEAKIVQLLSPHPHIVTLHNLYEDEKHLHMVLDLCYEPTFHLQVMPEREAASMMWQLMKAVSHCHRFGVAHRDIKPDNILLDKENRLKLADFGSADTFKEGDLMSAVVGTPHYVAPEVLAGSGYTEKVDVWSCGVVLYQMLAGVLPFRGDSPVEIFEAVLHSSLRFPTWVFSSVSHSAKDLLRRMLCREVSRRFSAEQVLRHGWFSIIQQSD
ncbi:phosphoenolpyruvate carboxylase kinase 1-like [Vigna unguiculata]|uniref:Calcium-dependent protein kinase n=1 Tax=Vigna unguiculata TaxID=3917 RepID=A0A4D6MXZ0_VIGUN|nr:phosphoenolpyruvate carboxylase kinase 1-like [Vigna unguiculata]QCE06390.1 calcium-dependent protein kinase [Vigna unguiculata]